MKIMYIYILYIRDKIMKINVLLPSLSLPQKLVRRQK